VQGRPPDTGLLSFGRSKVVKARDCKFVDQRLTYGLLSKQIRCGQVDDLVATTAQNGLGHIDAKAYCLLQLNSRRHRELLPGGYDVD